MGVVKLLDQETMGRLFEITDELGIDREEISVPLERHGAGTVDRRPDGTWHIALPEEDLDGFLERLPALLGRASE